MRRRNTFRLGGRKGDEGVSAVGFVVVVAVYSVVGGVGGARWVGVIRKAYQPEKKVGCLVCHQATNLFCLVIGSAPLFARPGGRAGLGAG